MIVLPATAPLRQPCATRTIQPTPNLSVSMPKRGEKNVFAIGMVTCPPAASALKVLSASLSFLTAIVSKALEIGVAGAAPVRHQNRRIADLNLGVHHFVGGTRRNHRLVRRLLKAHQHFRLGADRRFVESQRFVAFAVEKQIRLQIHYALLLLCDVAAKFSIAPSIKQAVRCLRKSRVIF